MELLLIVTSAAYIMTNMVCGFVEFFMDLEAIYHKFVNTVRTFNSRGFVLNVIILLLGYSMGAIFVLLIYSIMWVPLTIVQRRKQSIYQED